MQKDDDLVEREADELDRYIEICNQQSQNIVEDLSPLSSLVSSELKPMQPPAAIGLDAIKESDEISCSISSHSLRSLASSNDKFDDLDRARHEELLSKRSQGTALYHRAKALISIKSIATDDNSGTEDKTKSAESLVQITQSSFQNAIKISARAVITEAEELSLEGSISDHGRPSAQGIMTNHKEYERGACNMNQVAF